MPKVTKNVISREEAIKISKDYVDFSEHKIPNWFALFSKIEEPFRKMKRGDKCLTCSYGQFVIATVSSVKADWRADDGPMVRVSNGEFSWRVDGDGYAFPIN